MQISSNIEIRSAINRIRDKTQRGLDSIATTSRFHPNALNVKITTVITKIFNAKITPILLQNERFEVFSGERTSEASDLTLLVSNLFSMTVLNNTEIANIHLLSHIESKLKDEKSFHLEKIEISMQLIDNNGTPLCPAQTSNVDFNQPTPALIKPCFIS